MAGNYTIKNVRRTTELQGGSNSVAVNEYSVITAPSLVFFQFRRTLDKTSQANIASVAGQLATRIEEVMAEADVTAISYSQDVNQAGELLDNMYVYYTNADQTVSGHITTSLAAIGPNATPPLVAAAIAAQEAQLG